MSELNGHKKNGLPNGWEWIELGRLCEKVSKVKLTEQDQERRFFYLDIGSVDNTNNKIIGHKTYKWKDAPSRAQQIVHKDDVLFSTVRTYLKNIALIDSSVYDRQIASSGFTVLRGKKNVLHPKFLFYRTISNAFLEPLNKLQTGSSYPAVRDKDVLSQMIPVPCWDVQQQIVSKIEELFSELDKRIEQLKTAQQQLKVYRQSVLKWAFEGKLTNENVKDGELPEEWEIKSIGEIFEVFVGSTPSRKQDNYWNGDISWVSSGEVAFCKINSTKETITQEGLDNSSCKVHPPGTVIVAMIGEGKTRGQSAILDIHASHNQNTAAIRAPYGVYKSELLYYYFFLMYEENRKIGSGNNQKALNKERVKSISIPLIPFEEQETIVQEIESRLSVADKLEETITNGLQQAEALRQSILKKAFEGQLIGSKVSL